MIQFPWTYIYVLTNAFFFIYLVVREFLLWSLKGVVFFPHFFYNTTTRNDQEKEKNAFVRMYIIIYVHGS